MNAKSMNTASATAKIEGSKEARPPGGFPLASAPKKIFICSPYRLTANDAPCRKAQLEANSLQDSCHDGSPAAGTASVFYPVLKG